MGKEVYIVHCIDTEGPLYESIEVTFEMVNQAFGIKLEPTFSNLKKLQNKDINLASASLIQLNGIRNKLKGTISESEDASLAKVEEVLANKIVAVYGLDLEDIYLGGE